MQIAMNAAARQIAGTEFQLGEKEIEVISKIKDIICREKGVLIIGPTGSGKTFIMDCMSRVLANTPSSFGVASARHIVREFKEKGQSVLDEYGRKSFVINQIGKPSYSKPINLCIDDLGFEEVNTKMYGNIDSVIAEILADRYEMFKKHKLITHGTSNMNEVELKKCYGERLYSRMREMFEVIIYDGKDRRKA